MKTRFSIILTILLFFSSVFSWAVDDDCPCRKRKIVKEQIQVIKKVEVVKRTVLKRYSLFEEIPIPYERPCKGNTRERQNFKVRIMPNPVLGLINVIYETEDGQNVKIELLSCQGKLIKVLMNQVVYGQGLKESTFNISGQVSRGDAYIRLTSGVITKLEKIFIL